MLFWLTTAGSYGNQFRLLLCVLQELVVTRLESSHAAMADKNAANKRLVQVGV